MDIDLEHIETIEKFIHSYNSGSDIVVGIRDERKNDSFLKENCQIILQNTQHW